MVAASQELRAKPRIDGDGFGSALALSGDTLLVGAPLVGAAYVFRRVNGHWTQEAELRGADEPMSRFGGRVALSGDTALVLADMETDGSAVYVFVRDAAGWRQQARLVSAVGTGDFGFGWALAVVGDRIVVRDHQHDPPPVGVDTGAVCVFERHGEQWTEVAQLRPSVVGPNAPSVFDLAMWRDRVLVTSYGDSAPATAESFLRGPTGWTPEGALVPPAGGPGYLAGPLALSGDSAALHSDQAEDIVLYRHGTAGWTKSALLVPGDIPLEGLFAFGVSVSLGEALLAVGASMPAPPFDGVTPLTVVYGRRGAEWTHGATLMAPDGMVLGWGVMFPVAVDGLTVAFGVPMYLDVGRVFIYDLLLPAGDACTADADCVDGGCVEGVCCASPCSCPETEARACSGGQCHCTGGTAQARGCGFVVTRGQGPGTAWLLPLLALGWSRHRARRGPRGAAVRSRAAALPTAPCP